MKILVGSIFEEIWPKAILFASESNQMKRFCIYELYCKKKELLKFVFCLMALLSSESRLSQTFLLPVPLTSTQHKAECRGHGEDGGEIFEKGQRFLVT